MKISNAASESADPKTGKDSPPHKTKVFQISPLGPLSRLHLCYPGSFWSRFFARIPQ